MQLPRIATSRSPVRYKRGMSSPDFRQGLVVGGAALFLGLVWTRCCAVAASLAVDLLAWATLDSGEPVLSEIFGMGVPLAFVLGLAALLPLVFGLQLAGVVGFLRVVREGRPPWLGSLLMVAILLYLGLPALTTVLGWNIMMRAAQLSAEAVGRISVERSIAGVGFSLIGPFPVAIGALMLFLDQPPSPARS